MINDYEESDHLGIVEKVENGIVYTVEGNSGDNCRENHYAVGYYEVLGYGVPQYLYFYNFIFTETEPTQSKSPITSDKLFIAFGSCVNGIAPNPSKS